MRISDDCGVCGGDNSQCEEISGTYNTSKEKGLYSKVATIPRGSSNIWVEQRGYHGTNNDENYLGRLFYLDISQIKDLSRVFFVCFVALQDGETGEYVLNGKHMVSTFAKEVFYGGLLVKYSGSEEPIETISTPKNKKLAKDLIISVLSVGAAMPPDIYYRYIVSREATPR